MDQDVIAEDGGGPAGQKMQTARPSQPLAETGIDRFDFLKAQLTYYASHLQLADAKAGGIIIFGVAMARETGLAIPSTDVVTLVLNETMGLLGLFFSLLSVFFAFQALWPRTAVGRLQRGGVQTDVFSWMGVASSHGSIPHISRALSATPEDILKGIADTAETLALVIARKYVFIKRACWALLPATLLNVLYWVVA